MKKIIYSLLVVFAIITFFVLYVFVFDKQTTDDRFLDIPSNDEDVVYVSEYQDLIDIYNANKAINKDYVGDIKFESGIISDSFVQAKDVYDSDGQMYQFYTEHGSLVKDPTGYTGNDVYIWTYWKTGEYDYNDHGGSVFMEWLNELDDQNLIIYGHHFSRHNDESRTKAFTPLELLLDEDNYLDNRYLDIILKDRLIRYDLWAVYEFDIDDYDYLEKAQYWRCNYNYDVYTDTIDNKYYQNYIDFVNDNKLYDTEAELNVDDKTLTLQTCISGYTGQLFEIVVFKQIETIFFY